MTLSKDQKRLVRETWAQVVPIADTAAEMFYDHLFELDPSLRRLFEGTDMPEQRRKLMQTLGVALSSLDNLDRIVPTLEDLGRRHVQYGVEDRDYDTVGEALLWTLGRGLGDAFTPAARDAWAQTYSLVAGVMLRGAETQMVQAQAATIPGTATQAVQDAPDPAVEDVPASEAVVEHLRRRVDAETPPRSRIWLWAIPAALLVCLLVGLFARGRLNSPVLTGRTAGGVLLPVATPTKAPPNTARSAAFGGAGAGAVTPPAPTKQPTVGGGILAPSQPSTVARTLAPRPTLEPKVTNTPTPQPTATPTTALAPQPTATPTTPPTPRPVSSGIGVTRADWEKRHGRPVETVGQFAYYEGGRYLVGYLGDRVQIVTVAWRNGEGVDLGVARDVASSFLPADARLVSVDTPRENRLGEVYRSEAMARAFPKGPGDQRGILSVVYRVYGGRVREVTLEIGGVRPES